ncbi:MAG TPA: metallophosphoesterase family protein [Caulobacteraceae bacterium]
MRLPSLTFWRRSSAPELSSGGRTVYAIGDIHGRLDQLEPLIGQIVDDAPPRGSELPPALIFVGDYVDRGPDSKGVIDRVLALIAEDRFEVRTLKGNHEEAMLAFLANPEFGPAWFEHGGAQTLASYGVAPPVRRTDSADWNRARDELSERLPPSHRAFLQDLELLAAYGDYAFVHAGVRPGVPIAAQREQDLLWIREPFLSEARPFEKVIVHGHTPSVEPFLGRYRIGIDTGAYATGVLTAIRIDGAERRILRSTTPRPSGRAGSRGLSRQEPEGERHQQPEAS